MQEKKGTITKSKRDISEHYAILCLFINVMSNNSRHVSNNREQILCIKINKSPKKPFFIECFLFSCIGYSLYVDDVYDFKCL